ncbi:13426_t:CDS:2, partial [Gigaspora margarita]
AQTQISHYNKYLNIVKEPSGMPLSLISPPSKDLGELTPSYNPDIYNRSHNQHTKSYYNNYNSDFDGEEVVDIDIEDDEEFFLDDKEYNPKASEISFPRKDSITNFDSDNHNISSTPTKKKKKRNKSALLISQMLETLYNTYYEELELYANQQQQFGSLTIEYHNDS